MVARAAKRSLNSYLQKCPSCDCAAVIVRYLNSLLGEVGYVGLFPQQLHPCVCVCVCVLCALFCFVLFFVCASLVLLTLFSKKKRAGQRDEVGKEITTQTVWESINKRCFEHFRYKLEKK